MAFEKFFPNSRSNYGEGIMLQEYAGRWYLVEAKKPPSGDGTVYKSYGYKTFMKNKKVQTVNLDDGQPRSFPWSVCIGHDAEQAMNFLRAVMGQLPGSAHSFGQPAQNYERDPGPPPVTPDDGIPF